MSKKLEENILCAHTSLKKRTFVVSYVKRQIWMLKFQFYLQDILVFLHILPPFGNIRCFSLVKRMYLDRDGDKGGRAGAMPPLCS
jgi:hypothetical protein